MTNTLKNKWNNISEMDLALFRIITEVAKNINCAYFLIGAKARDILLEFHGLAIQRATEDTDIAVCCRNWDEFYKIKNAFLSKADFRCENKFEHRIYSEKYGILDIVPFGKIKEFDNKIKWPPEYDIEFSLIGFEDVYNTSTVDILIDDVTMKVTSPAGLVLLKLFAWLSRKKQKDALDLTYIVSNYLDLGNNERLQEQHSDLLDSQFDYRLTGCRLLGRDLKAFSLETKNHLQNFFENDNLKDNFASTISGFKFSYSEIFDMLDAIKKGLTELQTD